MAPLPLGPARLATLVILCALATGGCEGERVFVRDPHPTDEGFAPDRVMRVEVELAAEDWAVMRDEGRSLGELCSMIDPYTWYVGSVTVDGVRYENVEMRKKGFFGSVVSDRPSIKLRFAEGTGPYGLRRITLNNDRQDPSHLRQCLAYQTFARAGVPAPRCHHARVMVNGEELGVYTHVESINKPFLRHFFADEDGPLYEGQVGDFTALHLDFVQSKTIEVPDREFLAGLSDALAEPDDGRMWDRVARRVDIRAFMRFWAAEVLVGAWDGYSNNRNNWYAYRDPDGGRLYFIPWGPDATFAPLRYGGGLGSVNGSLRSVFTTGRLAARLYGTERGRRMYERTLAELLETAWDEEALLAEVDRVTALLGDDVDSEQAALVRTFIESTRPEIEAELARGLPPISPDRVAAPTCLAPAAQLMGTFDTTWDTLDDNPLVNARGTLTWTSDPAPTNYPADFDAVSGIDEQSGFHSVRLLGVRPTGRVLIVALLVDEASFRTGADLTLSGLARFGVVLEVTVTAGGLAFNPLGLLSDGRLVFDEANPVAGGRVAGSFEGTFYEQSTYVP